MSIIRRVRFENKGTGYLMRCNFCHRARKELYHVRFDANVPSYLLCPGICLEQSYANFQENKSKNLQPQSADTTPSDTFNETMRESMEDNIEREDL